MYLDNEMIFFLCVCVLSHIVKTVKSCFLKEGIVCKIEINVFHKIKI